MACLFFSTPYFVRLIMRATISAPDKWVISSWSEPAPSDCHCRSCDESLAHEVWPWGQGRKSVCCKSNLLCGAHTGRTLSPWKCKTRERDELEVGGKKTGNAWSAWKLHFQGWQLPNPKSTFISPLFLFFSFNPGSCVKNQTDSVSWKTGSTQILKLFISIFSLGSSCSVGAAQTLALQSIALIVAPVFVWTFMVSRGWTLLTFHWGFVWKCATVFN